MTADRPTAPAIDRAAIEALEAELGPLETVAHAIDAAPRFPREAYAALGRHGLLGLTLPEADGGRGRRAAEAGRTLFELAYRGGTLFAKLSLQPEFCSVLARAGSAAQRSGSFAPLLRGERLIGNQVTEPGAGSDAAALACRAERTPHGYRLTGTKSEAAFAADAEEALVYAKVPGTEGISLFLVPQDLPGITRAAVPDLGERWMRRGRVEYLGVDVPASARIGAEGGAFELLQHELTHERALLSMIYLGVAWRSWEEAVQYAGDRHAFGRSLSAQQAVAFPLVEDGARLRAAALLSERTLGRIDAGSGTAGEAAQAKWFAADAALTAVGHALHLHGGRGLSEELPFAQRFRDLQSARVAHGTDEIMHLVAARELLPRPDPSRTAKV